MRVSLIFLILGYIFSQFYRSFLAVLAPVLQTEVSTSASQLSVASGLWFGVFALMQFPVGWALDKYGPRILVSGLLGLAGAGGMIVFALASSHLWVYAAMILLGIACSPVLMASYFIFAHEYPAKVFGTMAGLVLGLGSTGNLIGSAPLAWSIEALGWRETMWVLAVLTILVAIGLAMFVRNPHIEQDEAAPAQGGLLDVLKIRHLWLILPLAMVNYAAAASMRGVWAGPYLQEVHGLDAVGIGNVTFWMAVAMIVGSLVYGPLDRIFGTRKWVVFTGNAGAVLALFMLYFSPQGSVAFVTAMLCMMGLLGASYPVVMAHGRSFFPKHLVGRGITLLNLCSIGGVSVMQMIASRTYEAASAGSSPPEAYATLFLLFGSALLVGTLIYAFSLDRVD